MSVGEIGGENIFPEYRDWFFSNSCKMIDWEMDTAFWVMPDEKQAIANGEWIAHKFGKRIEKSNVYIAPQYPKVGKLADISLLAQIEKETQIFLFKWEGECRKDLPLSEGKPLVSAGIFCTGAALAFLHGQQAKYQPGQIHFIRLVVALPE